MILWKTIDIEDTQRALLYRRGRLSHVLEPGRHRIMRFGGESRLEKYDVSDVVFANGKAKFLLNSYAEKLTAYLEQFDMADTEVGLFYRDDHLVNVLAPGSQLTVWKGVENVRVDRIDISSDFAIDEKMLPLLGRGLKVGRSHEVVNAIQYSEVPDEQVGLLMVNGKPEKLLEPGSYGFWKYNRSVGVKLLDLRLQALEVGG